MTGFQKQVNSNPCPGVAGDFASCNPRASVLAAPGALVAGAGGVTVGKFAWIADDGFTVQSHGTGTRAPDGFVHREMNALITQYLGEASMLIPEGFPVTLMNEGDFWAKLTGANATVRNSAIYADYSTGDIVAVSAPAGATATGSIGSTNTAALGATFTASADSDPTHLVVTSVTGLISVGDTVSGTGITAGTKILSQVSGTTGAAGTYQLSASNTASAVTVTAFGSVLKVTATTGLISVGDFVTGGAGFPVGATIDSQLSGTTGGAGNYRLSAAGSAYTASATGVKTFGVVLDITAVASGTLKVGDPVSGTGIPSGAVIDSQVSGTAGAIGIYTIDILAADYAASTTITAVSGVLTNFTAGSVAAVGDLVKITTWGN